MKMCKTHFKITFHCHEISDPLPIQPTTSLKCTGILKYFDSWLLLLDSPFALILHQKLNAVGNVSGYRCVSDCRSRGREFDPSSVLYFHRDWSWNYFYGHSPPFRWFIQEGLLSVTSKSMCTNYWLTACSSLPRKKCG